MAERFNPLQLIGQPGPTGGSRGISHSYSNSEFNISPEFRGEALGFTFNLTRYDEKSKTNTQIGKLSLTGLYGEVGAGLTFKSFEDDLRLNKVLLKSRVENDGNGKLSIVQPYFEGSQVGIVLPREIGVDVGRIYQSGFSSTSNIRAKGVLGSWAKMDNNSNVRSEGYIAMAGFGVFNSINKTSTRVGIMGLAEPGSIALNLPDPTGNGNGISIVAHSHKKGNLIIMGSRDGFHFNTSAHITAGLLGGTSRERIEIGGMFERYPFRGLANITGGVTFQVNNESSHALVSGEQIELGSLNSPTLQYTHVLIQ